MAERGDSIESFWARTNKAKEKPEPKAKSKDELLMKAIMEDVGITEYEPRVINQLLDYTYRYVTCVLDDAKIYANHAKKKFIHLEDIKLAVQLTLENTFTSPMPREAYLELARTKNHTPLPPIKPHCGLRLPPDRYCFSACNYKLKHLPKKKNNEGRQNIKFSTKGNNAGVKRQHNSAASASKAQNIPIPKPVFKFSTGATAKHQVKPKIQINTASSAAPISAVVKMEMDEMPTGKRKREEDEFEIVG